MKSGLTKVASRLGDLRKALGKLTAKDVLVGVPQTKGTRKAGTINNAALLYIHENGAPEAGIPARPTLGPGINDAKTEIKDRFKAIGRAAFDGRGDAVDRGLEGVGLIAASAVKNRINSNTPPPLKPATIAARRRRGVTRTNTLVDTAQMRNAVTYVVRDKRR